MIFLGEWCLLYDKTSDWSRLNYEVMDYPFDDRAQLYASYKYVDQVYHRLLPQLAFKLNEIHRRHHNQRYWEIMVGFWLRQYLETLYERYVCLRFARSRYSLAQTALLNERLYLTPVDMGHFTSLSFGDLYNVQLYSQIIRCLGLFPFKEIEVPASAFAAGERTWFKSLQSKAKQWIKAASFGPSRWNRVYLIASYFPLDVLLGISMRLKIFPLLDSPRLNTQTGAPLDCIRKKVFGDISVTDEFERVVVATLSTNVPRAYVENYARVCFLAKRFFPRRVNLIVTANAFGHNDVFKHWCGTQVECGVPYAILQHGGSYGCAKWNSSEDYETGIADYYYTYGWGEPDKPHIVPWISNKLKRSIRRSATARKKGCILWVLASFPRYAYTMYAVPIGPQFLSYLAEQCRFVRALHPHVRELLACRPYMHQYGWSDISRLKVAHPELRVVSTLESMRFQMKHCRLFVGTFNATAFLEPLAANIPTVTFWNPAHWELRPAAEPYFDNLQKAGILYSCPESAADTINRVYYDPEEWWGQDTIQIAREQFCNRFARTAVSDSTSLWSAEFKRISLGFT